MLGDASSIVCADPCRSICSQGESQIMIVSLFVLVVIQQNIITTWCSIGIQLMRDMMNNTPVVAIGASIACNDCHSHNVSNHNHQIVLWRLYNTWIDLNVSALQVCYPAVVLHILLQFSAAALGPFMHALISHDVTIHDTILSDVLWCRTSFGQVLKYKETYVKSFCDKYILVVTGYKNTTRAASRSSGSRHDA